MNERDRHVEFTNLALHELREAQLSLARAQSACARSDAGNKQRQFLEDIGAQLGQIIAGLKSRTAGNVENAS